VRRQQSRETNSKCTKTQNKLKERQAQEHNLVHIAAHLPDKITIDRISIDELQRVFQ
jgi:hypothetical protein